MPPPPPSRHLRRPQGKRLHRRQRIQPPPHPALSGFLRASSASPCLRGARPLLRDHLPHLQRLANAASPALTASTSTPRGTSSSPTANPTASAPCTERFSPRFLRVSVSPRCTATPARSPSPPPTPRKCRLPRPHGIYVDPKGNVFIADSESNRLRTLH